MGLNSQSVVKKGQQLPPFHKRMNQKDEEDDSLMGLNSKQKKSKSISRKGQMLPLNTKLNRQEEKDNTLMGNPKQKKTKEILTNARFPPFNIKRNQQEGEEKDELCKQRGKNSNTGWLPIPYEPRYQEYHPCIHRWMKEHSPPPPLENVRYFARPLSERTDELSQPHIRTLLVLWLEHSEILSPERRARLLARLLAYGYTEEELEKMLAEEKRRKEIARKMADAGPFDVFDEDGNLLTGKEKKEKSGEGKSKGKHGKGKKGVKGKKKNAKGKKKGKKGKKTKGKKKSKKKEKNTKKSKEKNGRGIKSNEYMGFKAGKPGQLGPGWAHYTGMQLMLKLWSLAEAAPDETFLSRASAYFDIQASALLRVVGEALDIPFSPSEGKTTPHEAQLAIGCLNLVVWIALKVTGPAEAISDVDVPKLLPLRGGELMLKNKKEKAIKGKKKARNVEDPEEEAHGFVKTNTPPPMRRWTEQDFPFVKPKKMGRERASTLPEVKGVPSRISVRSFIENPTYSPVRYSSSQIGSISKSNKSNSDNEFSFMQSAKWYNPRAPEFMYDGIHVPPQGVEFTNVDGEPRWKLSSVPNMSPQPLAPKAISQYYPQLRPRAHLGGSGPMGAGPGPWYVMNNPQCYEEKPSLWESASTIEQVEMVADIVHTMVSTPELSMPRLLELVAELCENIKSSEKDEVLEPSVQLHDEKRTIILEKLFLGFFESKFRDFSEETAEYMRIICLRGGVLVRYLYQHTASLLWTLQQYYEPETSSPESPEEEPADDPMDVNQWDAWLQYLLKTSNRAHQWQQWLEQAVGTDVMPEDPTKLIQEAEQWLAEGRDKRFEGAQFAEKAQFLSPIYYRPIHEHDWEDIDCDEEEEWMTE